MLVLALISLFTYASAFAQTGFECVASYGLQEKTLISNQDVQLDFEAAYDEDESSPQSRAFYSSILVKLSHSPGPDSTDLKPIFSIDVSNTDGPITHCQQQAYSAYSDLAFFECAVGNKFVLATCVLSVPDQIFIIDAKSSQ